MEVEESALRYGPGAPSLDEFAGNLGAIVDGGARVLLLYSGSYPYYYNYEEQTADTLRPYGLHDQVESAMIRESDHVLLGIAGRQRFIERCLQATGQWFGVAPVIAPAVAAPRSTQAWQPALEESRCLL